MNNTAVQELGLHLARRIADALGERDWRRFEDREFVYRRFRDAMRRWNQSATASNASKDIAADILEQVIAAYERHVIDANDLSDLSGRAENDLGLAVRAPQPDEAASDARAAGDELAPSPMPAASAPSFAPQLPMDSAHARPRHNLLLWSALALALLSFAGIGAKTFGMSACWSWAGCFDSGWIAARAKPSNILTIPHSLGSTPRVMTVWFSPTQGGEKAWLLTWRWPGAESGNPISFESDAEFIKLHFWEGAPLFGTYNAASKGWTVHERGYFRVVVQR